MCSMVMKNLFEKGLGPDVLSCVSKDESYVNLLKIVNKLISGVFF